MVSAALRAGIGPLEIAWTRDATQVALEPIAEAMFPVSLGTQVREIACMRGTLLVTGVN